MEDGSEVVDIFRYSTIYEDSQRSSPRGDEFDNASHKYDPDNTIEPDWNCYEYSQEEEPEPAQFRP